MPISFIVTGIGMASSVAGAIAIGTAAVVGQAQIRQ